MVVAACMLFSNTANAQLGINVGYSPQQIVYSYNSEEVPVHLPVEMEGIFVGVNYNKNLSGDVGISVGLQYRSNNRIEDKGEDNEAIYKQVLFDIPVLFNYAYKINDNLKISAFVGTTFNLALGGISRCDYYDVLETWYYDNQLNKFDIAATLGFSAQYSHYRLFFGYSQGLLDLGVDESPYTFNVKVSNVFIGTSYVF